MLKSFAMESLEKSTLTNEKKKRIINIRYLFYLFLAFLMGILFARKMVGGDGVYIVGAIVIFAGLTIGLCLKKKVVLLGLIFIIFFCGNGMFFLSYNLFMGKEYEGQCAVVGRVSDDFAKDGNSYKIKLDSVSINGENSKNIFLIVQGGEDIQNGDILAFSSEIAHVNMFELGNLNLTYLRDRTPYTCTVNFKDVVVSDETYVKYDEAVRASVKKQLFANMTERNAGICFAVLFGDKSMVDDEIEDAYRVTGIIHMLTVSGLHFGFLISLIYFALKPFKFNKYIKFSILFTILLAYNVICGFAPSVLRASIMALVILLSKMFGREYDALSSLALSGFIILIINPLTALDVGFLMSFFCVSGIFLLYRPLNNIFRRFLPRAIAGSIAVSITSQLGILCFFASMFQSFNILSFFANLVIIPLFGLAFPILFVLAFISPLIPVIGRLLIVVDLLFVIINWFALFFATTHLVIPLRTFDLPIGVTIFFFIYICSCFLMIKSLYKIMLVSVLTLFTVVSFVFVNLPRPFRDSVSFIESYGQTAQLVTSRSGQRLLIGNVYSRFFDKFTYLNKIEQIDYVYNEEITNNNFEDFFHEYEKYYVKAFMYGDTFVSNSDSFTIEYNKPFAAGDFVISKCFFVDEMLGYDIEVDNFKYFFASEGKLSYNYIEGARQLFKNRDYDIVYLGDKTELSSYVNKITVASGKERDVDFTYYKNGNFKLEYNKMWKFRSCD